MGDWVVDHGVVELLGADELDVGRDAVGRAEVERLLRLPARDATRTNCARNAERITRQLTPKPRNQGLFALKCLLRLAARAHADFN